MGKFFDGRTLLAAKLRGILAGNFEFADEKERAAALKAADEALSDQFPELTATMYLRFVRDGNRSEYDGASLKRRRMLMSLLLGVMAGEKEKYTDKLVDAVWATLENTSWVIPAHNVSRPYIYLKKPLPDSYDGDPPEIDLVSAETGALLSFVYIYAKDVLDGVTDVISDRIAYEIRRRIIRPYLDHEMRWITGFINNWVPWIVSNVLICAAVFSDGDELNEVIARSERYLDIFISTYGNDGGCNEGCSYWNVAIAALFDAAEILSDLTGDEIVFSLPQFRKMGEFAFDMCVTPENNTFVNFADCAPRVYYDRRLIARMGKRLSSEKLCALAKSLGDPPASVPGTLFYRYIKSLTEPDVPHEATALPDVTAVYPDLQVATIRKNGFFLAAKGGHNRESHNHNDIYNFILYCDGEPVFIDAGVGAYKRATFSNERYTLWTMQSSFHNLPEIGGYMQKDGASYRADGFSCEGDTVKISYASAYPEEAGVISAKREITLSDGVMIKDEISPDGIYSFMTKFKPLQIAPLKFEVGRCSVEFDCGNAWVEEVSLEGDKSLVNSWKQENIYRIRVRSGGLKTAVRRI